MKKKYTPAEKESKISLKLADEVNKHEKKKQKIDKKTNTLKSGNMQDLVSLSETLQNISGISKEEAVKFREENHISIVDNETAGFYPFIRFSDVIPLLPTGLLDSCANFNDKPSPIQSQTWPYALTYTRSIVGVAETGSGKTVAFGIPAIAKVVFLETSVGTEMYSPSVLILAPTRELAIQIEDTIGKAISYLKGKKPISQAIYGGADRYFQLSSLLSKRPQILVATPGRLLDFLSEENISLSAVNYFVLDEADRMLDMGFAPDVKRIVSMMENNSASRQTLMFSATWPVSIQKLAESLIRGPFVQISVTSRAQLLTNSNKSASHPISLLCGGSNIQQLVTVVDDPKGKESILLSLLVKYGSGKIILFVLYKKEADRLESLLMKKGFKVATIHGDKPQSIRSAALMSFKEGKSKILLATDVASRGLDIPLVETVINFTFPLTIEDYIHRIGRTGRAGHAGMAHTIFSSVDKAHSGELIAVLRNSNQNVPPELLAYGTSIKKKEHKDYGAHYRDIDPSVKPKHTKFGDDDDDN